MRSDDVGEEIISASHSSIELNVSGAVDSYKLSYIFSDVEVFLEARSARFIARCWSRPPRLPSRRTWSRSGVDRLFNAIAPYSCRSCSGRGPSCRSVDRIKNYTVRACTPRSVSCRFCEVWRRVFVFLRGARRPAGRGPQRPWVR
jgi:hypothetical protein